MDVREPAKASGRREPSAAGSSESQTVTECAETEGFSSLKTTSWIADIDSIRIGVTNGRYRGRKPLEREAAQYSWGTCCQKQGC